MLEFTSLKRSVIEILYSSVDALKINLFERYFCDMLTNTDLHKLMRHVDFGNFWQTRGIFNLRGVPYKILMRANELI